MHSGKPLTERLRLHSVRRVDHVLTGPSATVYALRFIIRAGISKQFHTLRAEIDPPGSATECFTHPGCPRHAGEVHWLFNPTSQQHALSTGLQRGSQFQNPGGSSRQNHLAFVQLPARQALIIFHGSTVTQAACNAGPAPSAASTADRRS